MQAVSQGKSAHALGAQGDVDITSEELADRVAVLTSACAQRIEGTGHEQYWRGSHQKFERMPLIDLWQETKEELQDLIAYLVMLHIRIERLEDATLLRKSTVYRHGLDLCLEPEGAE